MVHVGTVLDRCRTSCGSGGGGVLGQKRAFEEPLKRQDEMAAQAKTGHPWRSFAMLELVVPEESANTRSAGRIF